VAFEDDYERFLIEHTKQRKGERLRRLKEGHRYAEKIFLENVWFPAFGNFRNLHPEYEIYDFKDGLGYLDYAFIRPSLRLAVEIDGYGPHVKNQSRWQFSDQWHRQNHLIIDGWSVLRFTYDDIMEKPRLCQQTLQQFMGAALSDEEQQGLATLMEKEVIKLARRLCRPLTPEDCCTHFGIENKSARRLLQKLVEKQWLRPASGHIRIRSYILNPNVTRYPM
jgi:hypothetical protein